MEFDDLLGDDLFDDRPKRRKRDPLFAESLEPEPFEISTEEEQSILGMLGSGAMSAIGWAGEVLDKYTGDRALRGLLAGKPRELLSIIPLSDYFGITDREDMTTGKDLTGWDDPDSWWDDVVGMGAEIGLGILNPTNAISSAFDAVTDAGKIAQKAGLFDSAAAVASSKAKKLAGQTGDVASKVGGFEAQMTTSLKDLIEHAPSEMAQATREAAEQAAESLGKKLEDVWDQPLGHRLGYHVPFTNIKGPLPGFAAGDDLGLAAARGSDWLAETMMGEIPFTGFSPMKSLRALFDPGVQGAQVGSAQDAFAHRTGQANMAEHATNQQAIEIINQLRQDGFSDDEAWRLIEGIGDHFELPPGATPNAWQLHAKEFDLEAGKLRGAEQLKEYAGLDNLLKNGTPAQKAAAEAFMANPNSLTWKDLNNASGNQLGQLTAQDIIDAEKRITGAMGDYGMKHTDLIREALLDPARQRQVPQWAIGSAEANAPGQIAKLRPRPDVSMYGQTTRDMLNKWWDSNDAIRESMRQEGKVSTDLVDAYATRYATRRMSGAEKWEKEAARDIDLKHFPGGTSALTKMLKDVADKGGGDAGKMASVLETQYSKALSEQINAEAKMSGTKLTPNEFAEAFEARVKGISQTLAQASPESRAAGIFGNHPALDFRLYQTNNVGKVASLRAAHDALSDYLQGLFTKDWKPRNGAVGATEGIPVSKIAKEMGVRLGYFGDEHGLLKALDRRLNFGLPKNANHYDTLAQQLGSTLVPMDLAKDMLKAHGTFEAPDAVNKFLGLYDSFTQLFKTAVLTWPARYVRDLMSGQVQSMLLGNWSPQHFEEVRGMLGGAQSESWKRFKPVQEILRRQGIDPAKATAEQATHAARMHLGAMDLGQGPTSEIMRTPQASASEVMESLPGVKPASVSGAFGEAVDGLELGNALQRFATIEGVGGAKETLNPIVKLGNSAGVWTDALNRYVPYLSLLDQGYSPAAARARVMAQQIDYSGKALSQFEGNVMARLFPFYKFTRGMAKGLAEELWRHPRGAMSTVIRGEGALSRQDDGEFIPEHLRQGMALKVGGDGKNATYFTGLGLMHDDPLGLVRPGVNNYETVQGLLQEFGGRLNPLPKTAIELMTGKQLYSGRDLRDLDGSLARTISNAGITGEPPQTGILLEEAVAASPLTRLISTIRTATDPRKDLAQKAANLGTGFRFETVDTERAKTLQIRKSIEDMIRGEDGVKRFEHYYSPDESKLSPLNKLLMSLYKKMSKEQQKANWEAKKAEKASEIEDLLGI